ncbi:HD domain-containing protein [Marinifilum flexuosum]|uniref:HD domain-containing protein n=1 Tax=Marinifilum flexuosum TaxID=1117708 RepID=UPI002495033A|nr:HD domain-containing protein [Marinifilum flexuosum]
MEIIDLPNRIVELLEEVDSPERLKRHLQIVYSTASELVKQIRQEWPTIVFNEELILFGAGTHDIGKSEITKELYEKGRKHELKGKYLLQNHGFKKEEARFAFTHGNWQEENLTIEDLIVSLSDKIWKGKRIEELEEKVGKIISDNLNIDYWEVYVKLDKILIKLSNKSDELILWQNQ